MLIRSLIPTRYRVNGYSYNWEHAYALMQRIPIAGVILFGLFAWDETSFLAPFIPIQPVGGSMLPTLGVDGEVWLVASTWVVRLWRGRSILFGGSRSMFQKGDIIGFSAPDDVRNVSVKRVIGVSGDSVASCGQYVQLFTKQDPINLGRSWPDELNEGLTLDKQIKARYFQEMEERQKQDSSRPFYLSTELVPERHLWLESDCPSIGLDSRHYGPIPEAWVRGILVARLWPLWRLDFPKRRRPHPIAMDDATLQKFHIFRKPK